MAPPLAVDGEDRPHIMYCPPGEAWYAVREEHGWMKEFLTATPFGGVCGELSLGPDDEPQVGTPVAKSVWKPLYGVRHNGTWTFEPTDIGSVQDVDSKGRPHSAYLVRKTASSVSLIHVWRDSGGWSSEEIESFNTTRSIGSRWVSFVLDSSDLPRVLYYEDYRGQVRYASRQDNGTWSVEPVDTLGNIAAFGRQGSLALNGSGSPYAVYSYRVNSTTQPVKFAFRTPSGWVKEIMEPDIGLFPSLGIAENGSLRVAYVKEHVIDAVNKVVDQDAVYASRTSATWDVEMVYDGLIDLPKGIVIAPQFTTLALDHCGNPHIAFHVDGVYYATKGNCTSNRPPTANANGPYIDYEGSPLTFTATATDLDNDPLTYRWDFDNDGMADTAWSSSPAITHTWPDDFTGSVRVEASDGKTTVNAIATVTILNLPPKFDSFSIPAIDATATLRIAGEKWHDVSAYLVDGGSETLVAKLTRQPGKPQETSFPITIDPTRVKSIRVSYTPDDDKANGNRNGANPAWLTFTFDGGGEETFHHTFNVKHEDTWNWMVSLNQMLAGREVRFTATATDPGMDDLTFTWEWGDGSPATISSYPNGGTFPFTATNEETHAYTMAGTYDLKVTVRDDDGGLTVVSWMVAII